MYTPSFRSRLADDRDVGRAKFPKRDTVTHRPSDRVVVDPQLPVRKLEHIQLALPVPGEFGRKCTEPQRVCHFRQL